MLVCACASRNTNITRFIPMNESLGMRLQCHLMVKLREIFNGILIMFLVDEQSGMHPGMETDRERHRNGTCLVSFPLSKIISRWVYYLLQENKKH